MAEGPASMHVQPRSASEADATADVAPNHGIYINVPDIGHGDRPLPIKHLSTPAYQSPMRHHKRAPSRSRQVKETLDAQSHYGSSEDDGGTIRQINQYLIKQEIGRGSFGAVHLAIDQYGNEYAVKEFSKSRLRKRAQSNLLRKPNQARPTSPSAVGGGINSPLHRIPPSSSKRGEPNNSLNLIKEEIAIMKKLDHNNLVSLIEVLDDPQEDSLYMVLEICKKGVVMKVGLDEPADPYEEEPCRCWFRDMILAIEYLHAQGIIHRDIKPDNCLITHDDVLKIVDFGVSEMFEKESDMATAKSAGSPAFMPPELCVAGHGQVKGRAADIWSMGVTLYCLRYGRIPFEQSNMLDLFDSIRNAEVGLAQESDDQFKDLMRGLLEKDPEKRITMEELRVHPWVTKNGVDPLLPREENCADLVEPPTEAEMNLAITGNMSHLLVVMKAVKRFKSLLWKGSNSLEGIFGRDSKIVAPPQPVQSRSKSINFFDRQPVERALVTEGVHRDIKIDDNVMASPATMDMQAVRSPPQLDIVGGAEKRGDETLAHWKQRMETEGHHPTVDTSKHQSHSSVDGVRAFSLDDDHGKGHAHDPLTDTLYLNIGANPETPESHEQPQQAISESPGGVDENIYEQAYQEEMAKIIQRRGQSTPMHLTRRVDHLNDIRSHPNIITSTKQHAADSSSKLGSMVSKAGGGSSGGFASLVKQVGTASKGAVDYEDHTPTNEEKPGGVDGPVRGGTVSKEGHIPTNE